MRKTTVPSEGSEMFKDQIQRGLAYLVLEARDGMFRCYISDRLDMTDAKLSPPDVASSIIVLDVLERFCPAHPLAQRVRQYVEARDRAGLFSYFDRFDDVIDSKVQYPADVDDTAVAIMVVSGGRPMPGYTTAAQHIIRNTDDDGVIQVWLEPKPGHNQVVDAVVCVNALRLAGLYGLQGEAGPTLDYVIAHLESGRYLSGTRYYPTPQVFLYFLSKLEAETGVLAKQRNVLLEAVRDSLAASSGPANLAMIITAARLLCLPRCLWAGRQDDLVAMQQPDGSWVRKVLWRYGRRRGLFGSESLSTALAIEALLGKEITG